MKEMSSQGQKQEVEQAQGGAHRTDLLVSLNFVFVVSGASGDEEQGVRLPGATWSA